MTIKKNKLRFSANSLNIKIPFALQYFFSADSSIFFNSFLPSITIIQSFHYAINVNNINFVLPGCSFVEKVAKYLKDDGLIRKSSRIFQPVGLAKQDWRIFSAFLSLLPQKTFFLNSVEYVLNFNSQIDFFYPNNFEFFNEKKCSFNTLISYWVFDFYSQNSLSILSKVLSASKQLVCNDNLL